MKREVNPEIKVYIEETILPRYKELKGHTDSHIREVIVRSLKFSEQAGDVNIDMVYVVAAYHDLGRLIDNETHNLESAKMLQKDEFLKNHFSAAEIQIMAEAVEDHRASLGREPRSVYGKIVSSADRNPNLESMLARAYDYNRLLHPEYTEAEMIENVRKVLRKKYTPNGYAAKAMYFDDPDFEHMLVEVERITRSPEEFYQIQSEFNRSRRQKSPPKRG